MHIPVSTWSQDDTGHWKACAYPGCTQFAVEKTSHTPNADDGDCTTANSCTVCAKAIPAAATHTPAATWSHDDTGHWKACANSGCTQLAVEKTNHTPNSDDGDCTTVANCTVCQGVIPAETTHIPAATWSQDDTSHWKVCAHSGCTQLAVEKTSHTPNANDGDCATAESCTVCAKVITAATTHTPAETWSHDDTDHWKACTHSGCTQLTVEKASHIPFLNDGDCTTADSCTVCQGVIPAETTHMSEATWSHDDTGHWKACAHSGCTQLTVEKTSHAFNVGSNICECGYIDVSIFTITEGKLTSCELGRYYSFIAIPSSVTSIGDSAFSYFEYLKAVTIPDSVTSVGRESFSKCSTLTSITIPTSLTSSLSDAFSDCIALTSITVAEGNTKYYSVDNCIIERSSGTLVLGCVTSRIPTDGSVTGIGGFAFDGCSTLTSITIPNSVTSIGVYAFDGCSALTSITIPDSVTSIGTVAFGLCTALTNIKIPDSVTSIGDSAFISSALISITIPDSVTSIGRSVFWDCSALTSITLPNNLTSIPQSLFLDCVALASIKIPDSVTSIGHGAFNGCSVLSNITIPDSVTSIGGSAFWRCSALTSITIPKEVTSIGEQAFAYCGALTSIAIPKSVTSISNAAFAYCSDLTSITVEEGNTAYYSIDNCIIEKSSGTLLSGCENSTIPTDGSVTSIGDSAFSGCRSFSKITIPDGVTSIGDSAFSGCSALESIKIPDGVTSIGREAFMNCSALTSVTIPDGVTSIGESAFESCIALTSIMLPNSVTSIGREAFSQCRVLSSIIYDGTSAQWTLIELGYFWCDFNVLLTITYLQDTPSSTAA